MLCFVDDSIPGITRKRKGSYWQYFAPDGSRIAERDEIDRLNAIGMPPAYENCWFCPYPEGHIQAMGYDAKGRKQYRYHLAFRAQQEQAKYERLAEFGRALSKLRKRIEADLTKKPTSFEAVVAAVVRLIDETQIRVGNEEYAKTNKSFGATTLRNRHAKVERGKLKLSYTGKHGVKRTVVLTDKRLTKIARKTQELPGQHLFEYVDGDGQVHPVTSSDVNAYIKEATGGDFTAKDFRTWGASVIAFGEMARRAKEHGRIRLKTVMEPVAEALGNTPAISRKSYVHPALIEAAKDAGALGSRKLPRATKWLSSAERGLIEFLDLLPQEQEKLEQEVETRARNKTESKAAARKEIAEEAAKRLENEAA